MTLDILYDRGLSTMIHITDDHGLLRALIGDGRPSLALTAVMLFLSGAFGVVLSVRRESRHLPRSA